jgi:hypothetical protein
LFSKLLIISLDFDNYTTDCGIFSSRKLLVFPFFYLVSICPYEPATVRSKTMNTAQAVERMRQVIGRQHKALATEDAYVLWLRRVVGTHHGLHARGSLERLQPVGRFTYPTACHPSTTSLSRSLSTTVFAAEGNDFQEGITGGVCRCPWAESLVECGT